MQWNNPKHFNLYQISGKQTKHILKKNPKRNEKTLPAVNWCCPSEFKTVSTSFSSKLWWNGHPYSAYDKLVLIAFTGCVV